LRADKNCKLYNQTLVRAAGTYPFCYPARVLYYIWKYTFEDCIADFKQW